MNSVMFKHIKFTLFLSSLHLSEIRVISQLFLTLGFRPPVLKTARQYSNVTQTDTTEFLVINQSELEGDKFGLIAYCFILKPIR